MPHLTKDQIINNRRFIRSLRSGDYKQGGGQLQTRDQYNPSNHHETVKGKGWCCLGVATDVAIQWNNDGRMKWVILHEEDPRILAVANENTLDFYSAKPPKIVWKDFYGWTQSDPIIDGGASATTCNDHRLYNFNKIADLFEDWLEKNFNYTSPELTERRQREATDPTDA